MKKETVKIIMVVLVLAMTLFAGIAKAQGGGTTIATGFNNPQGVEVDADGNIWVIDSGVGGEDELTFPNTAAGGVLETAKFGESASVIQVAPDGTQTVEANLPSVLLGMEAIGGARLAILNGTVYATSGQWAGDPASSPPIPNTPGVVKIEGGQVTEAANTWPLESGENPDGLTIDTHPYGLTAGPDGNLWMADAGANDLVKIDPASGSVELVATFEGIPGPLPNPARNGAMEEDPVPTAVAFDQAGNMYVSLLSGFPFIPGSAKVVQVSADGSVSDYATGLTMLTDLRLGPDGQMYAVSFGEFGEQGPAPNSGAIVRVQAGDASEIVVSGLSFPTSIDFNEAGDAYVSINGVGPPGSGELVMFAALTEMPGTSPADMPPATLPQSGGEPAGGGTLSLILVIAGLALLVAGYVLKGRRSVV